MSIIPSKVDFERLIAQHFVINYPDQPVECSFDYYQSLAEILNDNFALTLNIPILTSKKIEGVLFLDVLENNIQELESPPSYMYEFVVTEHKSHYSELYCLTNANYAKYIVKSFYEQSKDIAGYSYILNALPQIFADMLLNFTS